MPQDEKYLCRIGNRWYAGIPVPSALRGRKLPTGGKLGPFYQRSLRTAGVREAQRRRWDFRREADQFFLVLSPFDPQRAACDEWRAKLKAVDGGILDVATDHGEGVELWNPPLQAKSAHADTSESLRACSSSWACWVLQ